MFVFFFLVTWVISVIAAQDLVVRCLIMASGRCERLHTAVWIGLNRQLGPNFNVLLLSCGGQLELW